MPGDSALFALNELAGLNPPSRSDTVVIVPAYKEAQGIGRVVDEIRGSLNPIVLVVNRPANDGTEEYARREGAIVLNQDGRGKGNAVGIGLDYVRNNLPHARFIGFMDADCTYPASPLSSMRQILESNPTVGMVVGQRENLKNNGVKSQAFAFGNRVLGRLHHVLNNVTLRDPLSGLRMVKADVIADWSPRAQGFDIECEMNSYVQNVKRFLTTEIPVIYRPRVGEKKLRIRDGFHIMVRMVRMALRRLTLRRSPIPSSGTAVAPVQH